MKVIPASVPREKPARKRAVPEPGYVITACGCICVPWPVMTLLGKKGKNVLCDAHGWQAVKGPASMREAAGLGKPGPVPAEPMF